MWESAVVGAALVAAAACSKPAAQPPIAARGPVAAEQVAPRVPEPAPDPCAQATALCETHDRLLAGGYLYRALDAAEKADGLCASQRTRLAMAAALTDLGMNDRAIAAHRAFATAGNAEEKRLAAAAINAIEARPSPTASASAESRKAALLLYRDGVNLRLDGDNERSIRQLRKSYALAPHPLTIVQIGLAHRAAERAAEARRAFARALALAESSQGLSAKPRIRKGHADRITGLAYQPDGRTLVSAGWDGMVALWDLRSGRLAGSLSGVDESVNALALSPDGAVAATAGNRGLRLWNLASGKVQRALGTILTGPAASLAFSPDGTRLATGGIMEKVRLWDVATGKQIFEVDHGDRTVTAVAFRADGRVIAVGGGKTVDLRDASTGKRLRSLTAKSGPVSALAFAPSGKLLASAAYTGDVVLWDSNRGTELRRLQCKASIASLSFSPDGTRLAVGPMGALPIEVWDVAKVEKLLSIEKSGLSFVSVAFSPDGNAIAAASAEALIRTWDAKTGAALRTLRAYGKPITDLAFSADGTRLASAGRDRNLKVWTLSGDTRVDVLTGHTHPIRHLAASPKGARLATAGFDGTRLWDLANAAAPTLLPPSGKRVDSVEFAPDGAHFALARDGGPIEIWDLGKFEKTRELSGAVTRTDALAFARDGRLLISLSSGPPVTVWDLPSGKPLRTIRPPSWQSAIPNDLAVHPSGDTVAVAVINRIDLIRIEDGAPVASLPLFNARSAVVSLAYNRDGTRLASGGFAGALALWDPANQKRLHRTMAHDGSVASVCFSPARGDLLASGSADKTVKLWNASTGALLATLVATAEAGWLVVSPDGRVDGSAKTDASDGGEDFLFWEIGNVQLPGFVGWQRYHTPSLLAEILGR